MSQRQSLHLCMQSRLYLIGDEVTCAHSLNEMRQTDVECYTSVMAFGHLKSHKETLKARGHQQVGRM